MSGAVEGVDFIESSARRVAFRTRTVLNSQQLSDFYAGRPVEGAEDVAKTTPNPGAILEADQTPLSHVPESRGVRSLRRDALDYHEQMLDAQTGCVPCKLCGGKAVITDAGTGAGYYIQCGNSLSFRDHKGCMLDGRRLGGWAYNVMDWWNRLHAATTPPARSYADGVADVVNLCRQWSEPGAKVLSSMSGLTDAEHAIAQRTAEGIAEAASALLSQGGKA